MHNIFLVCTDDFYYKNKIFDLNNPASRDDYYYPYYLLKKEFEKNNISLNTYDYFNDNDNKNYSLFFFDIPRNFHKLINYHKDAKKFLVIFETEVIIPENWDIENHKHFKKIFTWSDEFADGKKYIKSYWPSKIPKKLEFDLNKKTKLCTMVAGNKSAEHPLELYTERIKAIRWFEKNHPQDFDLYGRGWDRYYFSGIFSKLNRFDSLRRFFRLKYPSYRGKIESKREVLQNYKFAICYENVKDTPGYATEKIFDCFFAGCVPIYLGAPNITEWVPPRAFIDKSKFRNYEELYSYMTDAEYLEYLNAIKSYVEGDKIQLFSAENFVKNIISEILAVL